MKKENFFKLAVCVCLCIALGTVPYLLTQAKASSEAPQSIKIGVPIPISGRFAAGARTLKIGYEIGEDFINKSGGIYVKAYGKKLPLELIMLDDESDPVKTTSKMETLNEMHEVPAYLGGFGSSLHAAAAGVAEKNKIPYIGVAFTLYSIHQQGYKYLFSPYLKTPHAIKILYELLNTLPKAQRPTKIAIFRLATGWGIEQAEFIHKLAPPEYKIVMDAKYAPLTKDFTSMILKAKAAEADALWSNPIPPDGIALIRQSKELGWNPKFRYIVRASSSPAWAKALGSAAEYAICDSPYHWSLPFPGNKEFVEEYVKRDKFKPDMVAGSGYVCVQILANAIERAGSLDRDKIRSALAATDMVTIVGPISFNPDGTPKLYGKDGKPLPITGMAQWLGGKQELIWPKEYATVPFAYPAQPLK